MMRNKHVFQFSLTTIVSMLLVACGSNGNGNHVQPTAQPTPSVEPVAPVVVEQPKTEEPKAEEKKETSISNPDQQTLEEQPAETAFLGYKHVSKRNSGFKINMETGGANGSDKPVGMNVEKPNRSFDTLVVAEPVSQNPNEPLKVGYLEDLDFRRNNIDYGAEPVAERFTSDGSTPNDQTPPRYGYRIHAIFNQNDLTHTSGQTVYGSVKFRTPLHVGVSSTVLNEDGTHNTSTTQTREDGTNPKTDVNSKQGINSTKTKFTGLQNATALIFPDNGIPTRLTDPNNPNSRRVDKERADNEDKYRQASVKPLFMNYTDTHFKAVDEMVAIHQVNGKLKQNADGTYSVSKIGVVGTYPNNEFDKSVATSINDTDTERNVKLKRAAILAGSNSRLQGAKNGGYDTYENEQAGGTTGKIMGSQNVAEVYGYRTFASSDQYTGRVTDRALPNLPLENKQLKHVQYGRVTTHLSDQSSFDEFRKGVLGNEKIQSYVVDYGYFGQDGTEDHYFYRGVDGTTPEQLKALQAKGGVLKYWGHAVSYNLNNKYSGDGSSGAAPTAIGGNSSSKFVSGNHVHAWVDLTSNKVGGAIYNTWFVPTPEDQYKGHLKPVDLVTFEGTLSANGNIAGTSKLTYKDSAGVFGANLYGANATEMGGVVASSDKTEKGKWGAVFGAIVPNSGEIQNATNRGLGLGQ